MPRKSRANKKAAARAKSQKEKPAEKVEATKPAETTPPAAEKTKSPAKSSKKEADILKLPKPDSKGAKRLKKLNAERLELQEALKTRVEEADQAFIDYLKSEGLQRVARIHRSEVEEISKTFEQHPEVEFLDVTVMYIASS